MKDFMMLYGVTLGVRFTKKQKQFFLEQVSNKLNELNILFDVIKYKFLSREICNLVVGDIKKAKYVIMCAYDTPPRRIIPAVYYPFNKEKNKGIEIIELVIKISLFTLFIFLAYFLCEIILRTDVNKLVIILFLSLVFGTGFLILKEKPNKVNFSRNSASIALAMNMIQDGLPKNMAVVFADNAVSSFGGFRLFSELISKDSIVINLDSISSGESLVCAHYEDMLCSTIFNNSEGLKFYNKSYSRDKTNRLNLFENTIVIVSGKLKESQFIVENSRSNKDCNVDIQRLEKLKNVLESIGGE